MRARLAGIQLEGVALALLGFGVTRLLVIESVYVELALPFLLFGAIPLVLGLGLTMLGVVLAVGSFEQSYVRHVSMWSFLGTVAMVAILTFTMLGERVMHGELPEASGIANNVLVANVLLGGMLGGTVIGDRAARTARQHKEN